MDQRRLGRGSITEKHACSKCGVIRYKKHGVSGYRWGLFGKTPRYLSNTPPCPYPGGS